MPARFRRTTACGSCAAAAPRGCRRRMNGHPRFDTGAGPLFRDSPSGSVALPLGKPSVWWGRLGVRPGTSVSLSSQFVRMRCLIRNFRRIPVLVTPVFTRYEQGLDLSVFPIVLIGRRPKHR
jgi:hypothetical protein